MDSKMSIEAIDNNDRFFLYTAGIGVATIGGLCIGDALKEVTQLSGGVGALSYFSGSLAAVITKLVTNRLPKKIQSNRFVQVLPIFTYIGTQVSVLTASGVTSISTKFAFATLPAVAVAVAAAVTAAVALALFVNALCKGKVSVKGIHLFLMSRQ